MSSLGYYSVRAIPNIFLDMLPDYSLDSEEISALDSTPEVSIEEMTVLEGVYDISDHNNRNV